MNATLWATRRTGVPNDTQAPTVAITSPVGGETWKANSSHAITWTATDNVGVTAVSLLYSVDGGATYPNTIATGLANSGTYAWTVPNVPGTQTRVMVAASDAASNAASAASPANFTVDRWIITASAGANGTISPSGSVAQAENTSRTFTHHAGRQLPRRQRARGRRLGGRRDAYAFTAINANHTIAASFAIDTRTITPGRRGGSISPTAWSASTVGDPATTSPVGAAELRATAVTGVTTARSRRASRSTTSPATRGRQGASRSPDQATYAPGASVVVTAVPGTGFAFTGWSGDTTGTVNPFTATVTRALSYTATFADIGERPR